MSKGTKVFKRVEEELSGFEKALKYIPGYRGYKEKEIRRETDKLVRGKVAAYVSSGITKLGRAIRETTEESDFDKVKEMDRLNMTLSKIARKITHAPHGYAGMFDAIKVKEDDLDNLINFDASLTETAQRIDEACSTILNAIKKRQFSSIDDGIDQVDTLTERIESLLAKREETLLGIGED